MLFIFFVSTFTPYFTGSFPLGQRCLQYLLLFDFVRRIARKLLVSLLSTRVTVRLCVVYVFNDTNRRFYQNINLFQRHKRPSSKTIHNTIDGYVNRFHRFLMNVTMKSLRLKFFVCTSLSNGCLPRNVDCVTTPSYGLV